MNTIDFIYTFLRLLYTVLLYIYTYWSVEIGHINNLTTRNSVYTCLTFSYTILLYTYTSWSEEIGHINNSTTTNFVYTPLRLSYTILLYIYTIIGNVVVGDDFGDVVVQCGGSDETFQRIGGSDGRHNGGSMWSTQWWWPAKYGGDILNQINHIHNEKIIYIPRVIIYNIIVPIYILIRRIRSQKQSSGDKFRIYIPRVVIYIIIVPIYILICRNRSRKQFTQKITPYTKSNQSYT